MSSDTVSLHVLLLAFMLFLSPLLLVNVQAFYVSYEKPHHYRKGERLSLKFNKLYSPTTLSSIDYNKLPVCNVPMDSNNGKSSAKTNPWKSAVQAWHADSWIEGLGGALEFNMMESRYCQQLCVVDFSLHNSDTLSNTNGVLTAVPPQTFASTFIDAIRRDYRYQPYLDGLPVATRFETDQVIWMRYWGGVPIGQPGHPYNVNDSTSDVRYNNTQQDDLYVYNHWSWTIYVTEHTGDTAASPTYQVVRTMVQPISVQHHLTTSGSVRPICNTTSRQTTYDEWLRVPPQLISQSSNSQQDTDAAFVGNVNHQILFTYDVNFVQLTDNDDKAVQTRWDIFLTMDYAILPVVQVSAVLFGLIINGILIAVLYIWVNRDLSYKPVMMHIEDDFDYEDEVDNVGSHEEQQKQRRQQQRVDENEIKLWPLSTRLFFPPPKPALFAIVNGTGAHLFVTGFVYLFLFQIGLINLSTGANVITPTIIIYTLSSVTGGYVTGRLLSVFHYNDCKEAIKVSCLTALIFPLCGIVLVGFVYDLIPDDSAPKYHALRNGYPFILIWIFLIIPLTVLGGYYGHRGGAISQFPVSEGSAGYHDLDLQSSKDNDASKISKYGRVLRLPCMFLFCGCLPVLCCFISYSYGIGGPVLQGQYTSSNLNVFAPYLLFALCAGCVSCLLYYRQMRSQLYNWWWAAFVSAGSSGLWILFLSFSWLLFNVKAGDVDGSAFAVYFLWFAYIGIGTACLTGFIGVLCCIIFTRILYIDALRRSG